MRICFEECKAGTFQKAAVIICRGRDLEDRGRFRRMCDDLFGWDAAVNPHYSAIFGKKKNVQREGHKKGVD